MENQNGKKKRSNGWNIFLFIILVLILMVVRVTWNHLEEMSNKENFDSKQKTEQIKKTSNNQNNLTPTKHQNPSKLVSLPPYQDIKIDNDDLAFFKSMQKELDSKMLKASDELLMRIFVDLPSFELVPYKSTDDINVDDEVSLKGRIELAIEKNCDQWKTSIEMTFSEKTESKGNEKTLNAVSIANLVDEINFNSSVYKTKMLVSIANNEPEETFTEATLKRASNGLLITSSMPEIIENLFPVETLMPLQADYFVLQQIKSGMYEFKYLSYELENSNYPVLNIVNVEPYPIKVPAQKAWLIKTLSFYVEENQWQKPEYDLTVMTEQGVSIYESYWDDAGSKTEIVLIDVLYGKDQCEQ